MHHYLVLRENKNTKDQRWLFYPLPEILNKLPIRRRVKETLLVATGGAAGALFRYFLLLLFSRFHVSSLLAIWIVNVSGSFALGFLLSLALTRTTFPPSLQLLVGVGFLSSYTTFATLMWDTFSLAQTGSLLMALLNLGASFTIGLLAVGLGFLVGRAW
jgi:fluoride exporter